MKTEWDLTLFYKNDKDPKIEKDLKQMEALCTAFARKYGKLKKYPNLKKVLTDYEKIYTILQGLEPYRYYSLAVKGAIKSVKDAHARLILVKERYNKARDRVVFFELTLGAYSEKDQKTLLKNKKLSKYHHFLKMVFLRARHNLDTKSEQILSSLSDTSYGAWTEGQLRLQNAQSVTVDGKEIPLGAFANLIQSETNLQKRQALHKAQIAKLKEISHFAESEINAIFRYKKVVDELRGFAQPYESMILENQNDVSSVENLVKVVTNNFDIAHSFFALSPKLLGVEKLSYAERNTQIGVINRAYPFPKAVIELKKAFAPLGPVFSKIIDDFTRDGNIDVYPKQDKSSGAFHYGSYNSAPMVLLNHTDDLRSFEVFAHEMGHAFHSVISNKHQNAYNFDYSLSTAETASTFFEAIAFEYVFDSLSKEEKKVALYTKINSFISTVFRQIACFNFELDLHNAIREKGFVKKEEIAAIHNRNMQAYLGPNFDITEDDGYMFVQWGHIRNFFYVYTYAYGLLASSAMRTKLKKDPEYIKKVMQFLEAGGSDTPENILKKIDIDVNSPAFIHDALEGVKKDIDMLKSLL